MFPFGNPHPDQLNLQPSSAEYNKPTSSIQTAKLLSSPYRGCISISVHDPPDPSFPMPGSVCLPSPYSLLLGQSLCWADDGIAHLIESPQGHTGALFFPAFPKPDATVTLMNDQCSGCMPSLCPSLSFLWALSLQKHAELPSSHIQSPGHACTQ